MTVKEVTRQYRLEQWREIIQDRIKSGLKVDEYCRQNNISRHAYFYWLHLIRIEELNKTVSPVPAIVQVTNEVAFCELTPRQAFLLIVRKLMITTMTISTKYSLERSGKEIVDLMESLVK